MVDNPRYDVAQKEASPVILKTIPVGPLEVNCYLVGDESTKKALVIDPGENEELILATAKQEELSIELIVLTHGHFDHVSGVAGLKEKLPEVPFLAHEDDMFLIEDSRASAARYGIEATQCPTPDRFLVPGETLELGALRFEVLHTPGHSPGGVCLLCKDQVFVGDTLFQGSIGRTDFRGGSFETLSESIRSQLYTLPETTMVYPGHGPRTTIGAEKANNAFVRADAL